jgi:hypothetical protein
MLDVAVVSVLLDAGAGSKWKYVEKETGLEVGRSEGLGVASWHMFVEGMFSSDRDNNSGSSNSTKNGKLRVDAEGLKRLTMEEFKKAFQVDEERNPLVGCEGRLMLLHNLQLALEANPQYFGENVPRPGNMYDYLTDGGRKKKIHIDELWEVVVYGFSKVWPSSRTMMDGVSLGDAWPLPALKRDAERRGLMGEEHGIACFHKLSQWLTYSLLEVLEVHAGLEVEGATEKMTGLAEYRNGGLLLDMGVIVPKQGGQEFLQQPHQVHEPAIVEWRALTVALIDRVADDIRKRSEGGGLTAKEVPLAKILEAGTWKAGRVMARRLRPETGDPPIKIVSDGTVF